MPMEDAQLLLLTGDQVQMIEIKTTDPDKVGEILQPLAEKVAAKAVVSDWRSMNASLFEALAAAGYEFAYPTQTTFTAAPDGQIIMPYPEVQPVKRVDLKEGEA